MLHMAKIRYDVQPDGIFDAWKGKMACDRTEKDLRLSPSEALRIRYPGTDSLARLESNFGLPIYVPACGVTETGI